MEKFDKFIHQNKDILGNVAPLTEAEKQQIEIEKTTGFKSKTKDGERFFDNVKHEAKRFKQLGKCPALGSTSVAIGQANGALYKNKVIQAEKRPRKRIFTQKKQEQLLDYQKYKKVFWYDYLSKTFAYKEEAFVVDSLNKYEIDQMFRYFIKEPNSVFKLNKGLCVCGGVGTGKTSIMKAFSKFTNDFELSTSFKLVDMRTVNQDIQKNGLMAIPKYNISNYCFDDFAIRQKKIQSFGTEVIPVDEIIQGRYERFTKQISRPTHFTTNILFNPANMNQLLETYDERAIDRLKEMSNFVYLGGKSRRK